MKLKVRWAVPKDSAFSGELGTPNIGGARDLAKQGDSTWQTYKILNSLLVLILIYELSTYEINSQ